MPRSGKKKPEKKRKRKHQYLSLRNFFVRERNATVVFELQGVKRDLQKDIKQSCTLLNFNGEDIHPSLELN